LDGTERKERKNIENTAEKTRLGSDVGDLRPL